MPNNARPLFVFMGPSGSGKSTIVRHLTEADGLKAIRTCTTRPRREGEGDTDHVFVQRLPENVLLYLKLNGYEYGVTREQLAEGDLIILDPVAALRLLDEYKERRVVLIALHCPEECRFERMRSRGDSLDTISARAREENDDFRQQAYNISTDAPLSDTMAWVRLIVQGKAER